MEQNINIRRLIFHIFYIHFLYCELDWNKKFNYFGSSIHQIKLEVDTNFK